MSVIVVDPAQEDENQEQVEHAAPESKQEDPAPQGQQAPAAEELPEKFKGKSPAEIAKAYHQLEQQFGRQANEIGELRRTHDEFIRSALSQRNANPPAQSKPEQDDDSEFFVNPRAAIKKLLHEDEVIQELRQHKAETQQERNARLLRERHPDAAQIVRDPEFIEWVGRSQVRTAMLAHADRNYDAAAGDELLSTWKELKSARKAPEKVEAPQQDAAAAARQQARDAQLNAGVMPTGNAAPDAGGGKKVYRRVDIVRMMVNDPERYAAMGDEILAAYAEGRVK
jgi:hypothetical protein